VLSKNEVGMTDYLISILFIFILAFSKLSLIIIISIVIFCYYR